MNYLLYFTGFSFCYNKIFFICLEKIWQLIVFYLHFESLIKAFNYYYNSRFNFPLDRKLNEKGYKSTISSIFVANDVIILQNELQILDFPPKISNPESTKLQTN